MGEERGEAKGSGVAVHDVEGDEEKLVARAEEEEGRLMCGRLERWREEREHRGTDGVVIVGPKDPALFLGY